MAKTIYAEDINYWKTSQSSGETWMERTKKLIEKSGGHIDIEAFGQESGRAAYLLAFTLQGDQFKIIWPVLPCKFSRMSGAEKAARVQAATMLYHDVKAKLISMMVLGARTAFFSYLLLPNGQIASQIATPDIVTMLPAMFQSPALIAGDEELIEGEYRERIDNV